MSFEKAHFCWSCCGKKNNVYDDTIAHYLAKSCFKQVIFLCVCMCVCGGGRGVMCKIVGPFERTLQLAIQLMLTEKFIMMNLFLWSKIAQSQ